MAFDVHIADEAFADLDVIAGYIKGRASTDIARKWSAAMIGAIGSPEEMPANLRI